MVNLGFYRELEIRGEKQGTDSMEEDFRAYGDSPKGKGKYVLKLENVLLVAGYTDWCSPI